MGSPSCRRCRASLPGDARFCPNCGHPVDRPIPGPAERLAQLDADPPRALAEKMRSSAPTAERRPVTALFADVVGSTTILEALDPEEWTEVMNRAFELMSQAVYRYEGTIAHLLGDGLLAFFGAPVAHEDDPERAVRAGLQMIDLLKDLSAQVAARHGIDFRVRVGINTGPVVVGNVGSDLRYEYTAIGDAVNVAARVQAAAAPGSVLVAGATYRFVAPHFQARDLGSISVKGREEPVHVYEVLGRSAAPARVRGIAGLQSPMVGRDADLRRLLDLLDSAAAGGGRAAFVVGEPGIGKSRLLQEFRARAGERYPELVWAEGRSLSHGRGLPYHLLLDLIRSLLGMPEGYAAGDGARLRSRLEMHLGHEAERVSPYLAHLLALPLDPQEAGPVERLDPQARHARYIDSLEALLRAIARSAPLVLACEDVHWADESSIEALASLLPLAAEGRLLVLLTSRPDPETPGWGLMTGARLLAGESPAELRLGALSEDESRTLVSALLEIESLPGDVRSFILGRAEGNPFFVEEVIRMLIETGVIEERAHKWVAREGVASPRLPQTLHSLLLARIDRLPDDARHLLRVASVVGREFNVRVLAGVEGDREVEELLPALDVLQAYDLVRPSPDPATHYLFRHVLVQEAVYDSILQRDRTTLHIAVAEALQHMYPDRRSEMAGLLALHFERAGEIERAVDLLLEAGGQALLRFANKEALGFFARARLHLAGETRDPVTLRRRVMSGLGAARAGRTFTPHSQEVAILEALLPDAEALGDQRLLAETHLGIARARHAQGEIPGISAALRRSMRRAEEIAAALGDDPLRGLPLMLNGLSQFVGSRFRKAGALFREAVPLLEAAAWYEDAAYASGLAAISSARLGEWGTAETWSLRQAELAERSGDPNALLDADIHRGLVESERGNVEEAIELGRRGAEAAEQVDNKACAVVGHFLVGSEHFRSGRPEAAIEALERSTEIAQYCDLADVENLSRALLSAARSQLGRGEEALGELAVALARAREIGDRLGEGEILRHRAAVRARTTEPDWKAVDADFRASIAVFEDLETRPYLARALRAYASALEAQGRMAEARELLRSTRTESGDGERDSSPSSSRTWW